MPKYFKKRRQKSSKIGVHPNSSIPVKIEFIDDFQEFLKIDLAKKSGWEASGPGTSTYAWIFEKNLNTMFSSFQVFLWKIWNFCAGAKRRRLLFETPDP